MKVSVLAQSRDSASSPAPESIHSVDTNWPKSQVEFRDVDSLVPYARNARKHTQDQVNQIALAIREWGWTVPILVDDGNEIIAGHGRAMAAERVYATGDEIRLPNGDKLPMGKVPVIVAKGWSKEQKSAYVLADNRLAEIATWDANLLNFEIASLEESGFDISLTGFDGFEGPRENKGPDPAKEVIATSDLEPRFWISLRGPLAEQARVLDAVKEALGAPGEVEIDIGVIT